MRGEFIRADGLTIPNSITIKGASAILDRALGSGTAAFYMALVSGVHSPDVEMTSLTESTIGVNGYARQLIDTPADWTGPVEGASESSMVSEIKEFVAVGGDFDQGFNRIALVSSLTGNTAEVFMLSSALPEMAFITPTTPLNERRFRYRLYL